MKNRKSILVVFAILALLCLGIGYAVLTDSIDLTTTLDGQGSDTKVEDESLFCISWIKETIFIDTMENGQDPITVTPTYTNSDNNSVNGRTVSIELDMDGFQFAGDQAFVKVEVANDTPLEGVAAKVVLSHDNSENLFDDFGITYYFVGEEGENLGKTLTIGYQESAYVMIEIYMKNTLLTSADKVSGTWTLTATGTSVEE